QVQGMLHADEALLLFLDTPDWKPTPEETFIWLVTKTDARWERIDLGTRALTERVAALRCGVDQTLWDGGDSTDRCNTSLKASPREEEVDGRKVQVLPFDVARAHELYKALLGPVEDLIKGKHLLVVPSG